MLSRNQNRFCPHSSFPFPSHSLMLVSLIACRNYNFQHKVSRADQNTQEQHEGRHSLLSGCLCQKLLHTSKALCLNWPIFLLAPFSKPHPFPTVPCFAFYPLISVMVAGETWNQALLKLTAPRIVCPVETGVMWSCNSRLSHNVHTRGSSSVFGIT